MSRRRRPSVPKPDRGPSVGARSRPSPAWTSEKGESNMNEQQNGQQLLQSHDEHNSRTTAYWPANRSEDVLDQTIGEALREAALRHGPRTALIDGTLEQGRRQWSFNDLLETAEWARARF